MYDLNKGRFAISVSVGKSFQTRLQEGQAEIGGVLEKAPQLMPVLGDIYFKYRSFPGHIEIADRLARLREKQFPGLGEDEEGGMTLDQAKAMLEKQQGMLQEMDQRLKAAMMEIQVDRAKQEATLQKTQMETQSREVIEQLKANTELLKEVIRAQSKKAEGDEERMQKADEGERGRQHEAMRDGFEAAHEENMALLNARRQDQELKEPE